MLRLGLLAGAVLIGATSAAASAQMMGAPMGAPMQPGGWGHGGWQAGAPMPGTPHPDMHMAPPAGTWHGGGRPPQWHGNYHRPVRGWRLPRAWMNPSLIVTDWRGWGFGEPGPGMQWVRYYDDAVLIDGDGRVVDCRYGVDWDGGSRGSAYATGPAYAAGSGYASAPGYAPPPGAYPPGPGYGYPAPGVTSYRAGPNTMVTTSVTPMGAPMVYTAGGCGVCGGGAVVTVTPGMAVTTTTTTTDYETVYKTVAVRKRRVWHRPIRHYHPRCVRMTCPVQGS